MHLLCAPPLLTVLVPVYDSKQWRDSQSVIILILLSQFKLNTRFTCFFCICIFRLQIFLMHFAITVAYFKMKNGNKILNRDFKNYYDHILNCK